MPLDRPGQRVLTKELQLARTVCLLQCLQEAPPKQAREHPHRQEEARLARHPALAIRREPTTRHNAVHMGMVRQCRSPGVQHQRHPDLRTQVLGICGNGGQRFSGDLKQQAIDHSLVVIRNITDGCR
jgi:hypothetical protein